jgi:hypothetical protein
MSPPNDRAPSVPASSALSVREWAQYDALQTRLPPLFTRVFADRAPPRTVVVVPGISLDPEVLANVTGARFYEERMLSMLMLLRMPNTKVVFVTSTPIDAAVIDYYLGLLPGIPTRHARQRLTLLSCHDASLVSLTSKILERPRLIERIRAAIDDPESAHLSVFNATEWEARLAVLLGIPLYACDPRLSYWGTKSGSREAFRRAGVALPDGAERMRDLNDVAEAIVAMRARDPHLRRVVVKLEEGFSGDGNARFSLALLEVGATVSTIAAQLRQRLEPEATAMTAASFAAKFERAGGIVEAWLEGEQVASPSVQLRINPLGAVELISTHDQILGGRSGQVFLGSRFPANEAYRRRMHEDGAAIGRVLAEEGVLGRFSIDFLHYVPGRVPGMPAGESEPQLRAIEINLRKGGTTLPFQMLQFLTAGHYDVERGELSTRLGQPRCYVATDNLQKPAYRGLVPDDLIDILVQNELHFDDTTQTGIVFNLIGALSEFGKLGLVSIAETPAAAQAQYDRAAEVLDRETAASRP